MAETRRKTALNLALVIVFVFLQQLGQCEGQQDIYVVLLKQAPVISYDGSISGYTATRPSSGQAFDSTSAAAGAYRTLLRSRQTDVLRNVVEKTPIYSVTNSINALTLKLSPGEVELLEGRSDVLAVVKNELHQKATTHTPEILNLPNSQWKAVGGQKSAGEGIVIGVIDSGIYPEHPSFAASGYAPLKGWKGKCMETKDFKCNNKIISAAYFLDGLESIVKLGGGSFNRSAEFISARAKEAHGTHTASTAAGNAGVPVIFKGEKYGVASGIAPRARLGIYKVLWDDGYYQGGTTADIVMGIDRAISDGCNVLSYSVGSRIQNTGSQNFLNPIELQFLIANRAGILVAAAAGNSGLYSTDKVGPWYLSVASSNTPRTFSRTFTVKGPTGTSVTLNGVSSSNAAFSGRILQVADVVYGYTPGNSYMDACMFASSNFDSSSVKGSIIICSFLDAWSVSSVLYSLSYAGAKAVIFKNTTDFSFVDSSKLLQFDIPFTLLDAKASIALFKFINGTLKSLSNTKGCIKSPPPPPYDWWLGPSPSESPPIVWGGEPTPPNIRRRLLESKPARPDDSGPEDPISPNQMDDSWRDESLLKSKTKTEALEEQQPRRMLAKALPCNPTTANTAFTAVIGAASVGLKGTAPTVSSFSSTGPNNGDPNILKPDILAPGENIFGAWSPQASEDAGLFNVISGTSMATPHIAGILALLRQQYKKWSPPAIYSYLLTRSSTMNNKNKPIMSNGYYQPNVSATSFDMGHGFVNPSNLTRPGLVHDMEYSEYSKFLCSLGINANLLSGATGITCSKKANMPWDLNIPSITISIISTATTIKRTVTNFGVKATYKVSISPPQGFTVKVSPTSFTLETGKTTTYEVILTPKVAYNKYVFGSITWSSGASGDIVRVPITAQCNNVF